MAHYQRELDYMTNVLRHMRLQVHHLRQDDPTAQLDLGFHSIMGLQADFKAIFTSSSHWTKHKTIFKILDQFLCNYLYFRLPDSDSAVVIGPYLTFDPTREQILEQAETMGIPIQFHSQLSDFYASLPVYTDTSMIMALLTTFGHVLWGENESFEIEEVNFDQTSHIPITLSHDTPIEQQNILLLMKQMEDRYAHENLLMEIVSKGLSHKAEMMMSSVSHLNFQPRMSDPLRNLKNYCIICNTLLRKAAQKGGVHPLHLDRISTKYARSIESIQSQDAGQALIGEMVHAYCRLVKTHSLQQYSPIIQKTLTYIEANLSGDLSLHAIAEIQTVTPGYLSSLFHKEVGQTLIEYVNEQRMKTALQLIKGTQLQVQTIAQLCGFGDPNYFTKLFKQHFGITPIKFRKNHSWPILQNTAGE